MFYVKFIKKKIVIFLKGEVLFIILRIEDIEVELSVLIVFEC